MEATLVNIQRFSIHDGPGIRTTVFFKGCPLSCTWCANPESQSPGVEMCWEREKCVHCLSCIHACPTGAIEEESGCIRQETKKCKACGQCLEACPTGALQRYGKRYDLDELVEELQRDKDFYEDSGGGVTFSGGEFLMQADFAMALAERLHEHGIPVAGETSGFASEDVFARMLPLLDFLYFDMKHHDREKHREFTGVFPDLIWKNLETAVQSRVESCVRIPVIPAINDGKDDAAMFAQKLKSMGIQRVQLLPFHSLGQKKYDTLGRKYAFAGTASLTKKDLLENQRIFQAHDVWAFF